MCGFAGLDSVQEGQLIGRDTWSHWDAEKPRELPVGGVQTFTHYVIGSDTETASTEGNINSESEYDIGSDFESDMSAESEIDWENENENESVPQNMDNSPLTPRGMSMSPVNYVHVPASPIYSPYSPTSPDYSPSMGPLNIDSDNSEITPTNSYDGIISRKDYDMFDMSNSDSDLDVEGEAETKSLVGEFINRGNCLKNYMAYLFFLSLQTLTI